MIVAVLLVLQVELGCLLWGAEAAKVVEAAGWCVALSLVPALVWSHSLVASTALVRRDQLLGSVHADNPSAPEFFSTSPTVQLRAGRAASWDFGLYARALYVASTSKKLIHW